MFHVVIWTEGDTGPIINFAAAGATFGERANADRVAAWFRAGLEAGYAKSGARSEAYRSRVGVLEMPRSDPRLGHPAPYTSSDVDAWIASGSPPSS